MERGALRPRTLLRGALRTGGRLRQNENDRCRDSNRPTLHLRQVCSPLGHACLFSLDLFFECLARPPATRSRLCRLRGGSPSVGGASGGFRIFLSPYAIRSSAVLLSSRASQASACVGSHSPRVPVRRNLCGALLRPGLRPISGGALPRPPASAATQRVWRAAQAHTAPCNSSGRPVGVSRASATNRRAGPT